MKRLEGCVKRGNRHIVYDDATGKPIRRGRKPLGNPTIGWGHLIGAGESFPVSGIDDARADAVLAKDLEPVERVVDSKVNVPLSQSQYDSLCIFTLNVGVGGFRRSTALKRLNAGDYEGCAAALQWWNKTTIGGKKVRSDGLVRRREIEADLFLSEPPPDASRVLPAPADSSQREPKLAGVPWYQRFLVSLGWRR